MDHGQTFAIGAAGLSLERARVEVAVMNLAHANTVQDPSMPGYRPMQVVGRAGGAEAFGRLVDDARDVLRGPVAVVEPQDRAPRLAHEPGHPLADPQGFVAYPGVDPAREMVTLMGAMRAYEANLAALNTARALALKALEIGRGA